MRETFSARSDDDSPEAPTYYTVEDVAAILKVSVT
jgi:hypothetical protein